MPKLTRGKSRLRRWVARIALLVALAIVAWLVTLWVNRSHMAARGREDLAEAVAEADAADLRWRWEQIEEDRPKVADAENSMLRMGEVSAALVKYAPNELMLPNGDNLLDNWPVNERLDAERLGRVEAFLAKQRRAADLAAALKDYPRGRAEIVLAPDLASTRLNHVDPVRETYHLLRVDAELQLHEGRPAEAADRVRALLNASAAFRSEPMLVTQLSRMAGRQLVCKSVARLLGCAELPDEAWRDLALRIEKDGDDNPLLDGLRGDRAAMHRMFENLESGAVTLMGVLENDAPGKGQGARSRLASWNYGPRLFEDHAFCLQTFLLAQQVASLPPWEQAAGWAEIEQRAADARTAAKQQHLIITALFLPGVSRVGEAALRNEAHRACVLAALAAERFRLANRRWPVSLDELRPATPLDPYTGESLQLARRGDGIVIYSVGQDRVDDGGERLGLTGQVGTDLGVRLYDPVFRGVEVLPMPKAECGE